MKISEKIVKILKNGGVGILSTDTLYGLVGSALSKKAVERIYKLKKRGVGKPFIILISKISDLKLFEVELNEKEKEVLRRFWPGPISIVLKCPNLTREMSYLRPLNQTLAFRCPNLKWLNVLLKKTGP
ncbi:MAG: Sua5/YciO/YrdC/YwlC family protein, partial [Candidatus Pacebacteria bacterium]|nr:Sua5/YciO/YrdC/YwlC family protein [Candidatus Paceibacterota bacterium]